MPTELSADSETRRRVNDNVRFITGSGLPTDGSTGADICGPSSFYFDITNKVIYYNNGTKAAPVWVSLAATGAAGSIGTTQLADLAVTTAKLANLAVTAAKIANGAVGPTQLAALAVETAKIALLAVGTGQLADLSVTAAKIGLLQVGAAQLSPFGVTPDKTSDALFRQATGTISSADIVNTGAGKFGHANGQILIAGQGAHSIVEFISLLMIYDFAVAAYTAGGNVTVNRSGGSGALTGLISAANSIGAAGDKVTMFYPLSTAGIDLSENEGINLVTSAAFTQPGTAAGVIRYVLNYRVHATGL